MTCPDDDTLVALVEHALPPAVLVELEAHVDSCAACRHVIASLAGVDDAVGHAATLAIGTRPQAHDLRGDLDADGFARGVTVAGRYVIESVLGRGGMGTVYLAHDTTLGRVVALKVHRGGAEHARLYKEAVAMARLAHPNVVTVFEVGDADGRQFVAMEYVRGGTLRDWLRREPRSWRAIVELMIAVGGGISAAHAAGLVHRDFKPENVLVGDDGRPRVSDFGLVQADAVGVVSEGALTTSELRATPAMTALTVTGTVLGTPAYMAPEQLAGGVVDGRCDQFSFCATLWEALYGRRPYVGATLAAIHDAIDRGDLGPPPTRMRTVPLRIRRILERGLRKRADDRYADMPSLLAALRARTSRRRGVIAAIGAVVIAAAAVTGVLGYQRGQQADLCGGADTKLAGRWDGERKQAVQRAFADTKRPFAADAWHAVEHTLDAYATRWVAASEQACRDTHVRHTQSSEQLERRVACLDDRLRALGAIAGALATAGPGAVEKAPKAVGVLPNIEACASSQELPPSPTDVISRARADELRDRLAAVGAQLDLGKVKEAPAAFAAIVADARTLGFQPVVGEALFGQARGDIAQHDAKAAAAHLDEAALVAEASRDDSLVGRIASDQVSVYATLAHDPVRAEQALRTATAWAERLGNAPIDELGLLRATANLRLDQARDADALPLYRRAAELSAKLYGADAVDTLGLLAAAGNAQERLGKYADAYAVYQDVLARTIAAVGPHHPAVGRAWENLGVAAIYLAHFDEAHDAFTKALAIAAAAEGPRSAQVASITNEIGGALLEQGRYADALPYLRDAVAMDEARLGADAEETAYSINNLAIALVHLDKAAEAEPLYLRSLHIYELHHGVDDPSVGDALVNLGQLRHARGGHGDVDALADLDRALAIYAKAYGADHRNIALALVARSEVLRATGKGAAALTDAQRSVAIVTKLLGADHPDILSPLIEVGEDELVVGQPAQAIAPLEHTIALLAAAPDTAPLDLAQPRFALARALWGSGGDRVRAHALAVQAADAFRADNDAKSVAPVDDWLRTHAVR